VPLQDQVPLEVPLYGTTRTGAAIGSRWSSRTTNVWRPLRRPFLCRQLRFAPDSLIGAPAVSEFPLGCPRWRHRPCCLEIRAAPCHHL